MIFPLEIIKEIAVCLTSIDYLSLIGTCSILGEYCKDLMSCMKEKSCRMLWIYSNGLVSRCLVLPNNVVFRVLESYEVFSNISKIHVLVDEKLYCVNVMNSVNLGETRIDRTSVGKRVSLYEQSSSLVSLRKSLVSINGLNTMKYLCRGGITNYELAYDNKCIYIRFRIHGRPHIDIINKREGTYRKCGVEFKLFRGLDRSCINEVIILFNIIE